MRLVPIAPLVVLLVVGVGVGACGSGPFAKAPQTAVGGDGSASDANSAEGSSEPDPPVALRNDTPSAKMVQQAHADVSEQSDLLEIATTGADDVGGSAQKPRQPASDFTFVPSSGANLNALGAPIDAEIGFRGAQANNAVLEGNASAHIRPRPFPLIGANQVDDGNVTVVLTFDVNRTLRNGDVLHVVSQPNLLLTKSGRRDGGAVVRTIHGQVHRQLHAAADSNEGFDVLVTHDGMTVTDRYTAGKLTSRTMDGNTTVDDQLTGGVAQIRFQALTRSRPLSCLCPTGGNVEVLLTDATGAESRLSYSFSAACGQASVAVEGSAAVAEVAAQTEVASMLARASRIFDGGADAAVSSGSSDAAAGGNGNVTTGAAGVATSSEVQGSAKGTVGSGTATPGQPAGLLRGTMSWQGCLPAT